MKKTFILIIIIIFSLTTLAQSKIINDVNNYINDKPQKISKQELRSKILNEWSRKELKFLELKNGTLIPMTVEKSDNLLKIQDSQHIDTWIIILASAMTVLMLLMIFKIADTEHH